VAALESSCKHCSLDEPTWVGAHGKVGVYLMMQNEYAEHDAARVRQAVAHFEAVLESKQPNEKEAAGVRDLLNKARAKLQDDACGMDAPDGVVA